ncbi:MAG: 50S ribosomal protein L10 [Clostridia bacterium]|nr:50S ribosomal protein L10 [Clostridia bacterium]
MSNNLEAKKQIVAGIVEKIQNAQSIVFVDYRGLNAEETTNMRAECRKAGVEYLVLKNTMIELAAKELNITGLDEHLEGPTAVAFSMNDPASAAKIMLKYAKDTKKLTVKCGYLEGAVVGEDVVQSLSELPSREVLIAKIMGSLNAPVTNFVYAVEAVRKKLAGEE